MNKKAIAPLIATVMLIGFVIVMGTLVFNWYSSTISKQQKNVENIFDASIQCSNKVDIKISNVQKNTPNLDFTIENIGQQKIDKFVIRKDGIASQLDANLEVNDIKNFQITSITGNGEIVLFPAIMLNNKLNVCSDYSKTINLQQIP